MSIKINKIVGLALVCVASLSSLAWGQCATWNTSTIRNCNGLDYELWNQNNRGTVNMNITGGSTNPNGGTFNATWSGTENILFRAGRKWGSNSTTTARSLGNIVVDFAATWTSSDNVKMLGIYGWAYFPAGGSPTGTENGQAMSFSNQIEYYIIQDRGSWNPASGGTNARRYGTGTIDGRAYEYWVADRIGQPMLTGNGNFKQYFSVPASTSSHRQSGIVNVARHFEEWHRVGMRMMDCPLYEVAMKVESFTGSPNGSGSANVSRNILTIGGTVSSSSIVSSSSRISSSSSIVSSSSRISSSSSIVSSSSNMFSLVTTVSPVGAGTITRSPSASSYARNTAVTLTATANTGWRFVGWEGGATGTTSPTTVTMSSDRTVTARFALISGDGTTNLITNGNFPTSSVISTGDGASWRLGVGESWGNSAATASVSGGTATINVTTIGAEAYQPQLVQYGLALENGVMYRLTFRASAAVARSMEVAFQQAVDPWAGYAAQQFNLTTTPQNYEFVFTMTSATDLASQMAFNLGQATGSVSISDVRLVHTTAGTTKNSGLLSIPSAHFASVQGRTLNISPIDGAILQVRVVDINGKVNANFQATAAATFSLANLPAGLYFVKVTGSGIKQTTPIVLQ